MSLSTKMILESSQQWDPLITQCLIVSSPNVTLASGGGSGTVLVNDMGTTSSVVSSHLLSDTDTYTTKSK